MTMKSRPVLPRLAAAVLILSAAHPLTALANSSWVWISQSRPYDVLPYVIAMTLFIEVLAIWLIPGTQKPFRVLLVVPVANLLSFAAPYLAAAFMSSGIKSFDQILDHSPLYTVGFIFLLITLAVEVPVVFAVLRKDARRLKRLLPTIILANTATTVLTALIERAICFGRW